MLLGLTEGGGAAGAVRWGDSACRSERSRDKGQALSMRKEESKAWLVRPWENSEIKSSCQASNPCGTGGRLGSRKHTGYNGVVH